MSWKGSGRFLEFCQADYVGTMVQLYYNPPEIYTMLPAYNLVMSTIIEMYTPANFMNLSIQLTRMSTLYYLQGHVPLDIGQCYEIPLNTLLWHPTDSTTLSCLDADRPPTTLLC